jgi:hypothetical protein
METKFRFPVNADGRKQAFAWYEKMYAALPAQFKATVNSDREAEQPRRHGAAGESHSRSRTYPANGGRRYSVSELYRATRGMVVDGILRDSGKRKIDRHGRTVIVWELVPKEQVGHPSGPLPQAYLDALQELTEIDVELSKIDALIDRQVRPF